MLSTFSHVVWRLIGVFECWGARAGFFGKKKQKLLPEMICGVFHRRLFLFFLHAFRVPAEPHRVSGDVE